MQRYKLEDNVMAKVKLICFDMEGTLLQKAVPGIKSGVAPSVWEAIAEALGQNALSEEKRTQEKYKNKKYASYTEWMEETIEIHRRHRLSKEMFLRLIDNVQYTKGVKEVFKVINDRGLPTCLISGGFKNQADRLIQDLKIKHAFVACEYFWDRNGFLDHWNLLPADKIGKKLFLNHLIHEYGFDQSECLFVGDGENDVPIAQEVGFSIAFNAQDELKKVATHIIDQAEGEEDFQGVLNFLNEGRLL